MKTVFIAMFTIASFSAIAQEGFRHGPHRAEDPLTPEQVATLQTKRMTLALDLTQLQQEQVRKFHLENAKLRQEKMEARKEGKGERSGKDLSAEERFTRQNERLDHMIASKEKMREILSPEQFGEWEKSMQHKMGHRHKRLGEKRGRR